MADQKISQLTTIVTVDTAADLFPIVDTSAAETKKITPTALKTALSLNNVDNTSDANKPISSATQTERYNKFAVIEGTTFDLDAGEFEYVIYAQTSSTNLAPSLANEEVESGVLKVEFDVTRTSYEVTLNEKIYEIEQPTQILFMLLENGDFVLLESGDKILL